MRSGDSTPIDAIAIDDAGPSAQRSPLSTAATMLAWLSLFLLGYLVAGSRSRWEQEKIIEGTVAHYGYSKVMKLGLEQDLLDQLVRLWILENAAELLSRDEHAEDTEERADAVFDGEVAHDLAVVEVHADVGLLELHAARDQGALGHDRLAL